MKTAAKGFPIFATSGAPVSISQQHSLGLDAPMHDWKRVLDLLDGSTADYTLPQAFYTDADLYEFDVSAVFTRSWMMIGFEAELPDPGSYVAVTIGKNP